MNTQEKKVFKSKFKELLEHVRVYGTPTDKTHFVIDKMMYYRLKAIKEQPDKLDEAKKLDTKGIIF